MFHADVFCVLAVYCCYHDMISVVCDCMFDVVDMCWLLCFGVCRLSCCSLSHFVVRGCSCFILYVSVLCCVSVALACVCVCVCVVAC